MKLSSEDRKTRTRLLDSEQAYLDRQLGPATRAKSVEAREIDVKIADRGHWNRLLVYRVSLARLETD